MGADHPIIWSHCVGRGRSFYSALGHKGEYYAEPLHVELLEGAIAWAAGLEEPDACAAAE
jgi:type 1 glutamine amidotransferase